MGLSFLSMTPGCPLESELHLPCLGQQPEYPLAMAWPLWLRAKRRAHALQAQPTLSLRFCLRHLQHQSTHFFWGWKKEIIGRQRGEEELSLCKSARPTLDCGSLFYFVFIFFFGILLILEKERERNIDLLFHLFMHSLVVSYMCPDQGIEPTNLVYWDDALTN